MLARQPVTVQMQRSPPAGTPISTAFTHSKCRMHFQNKQKNQQNKPTKNQPPTNRTTTTKHPQHLMEKDELIFICANCTPASRHREHPQATYAFNVNLLQRRSFCLASLQLRRLSTCFISLSSKDLGEG